jgi:ABC-2 type transport system permease protein
VIAGASLPFLAHHEFRLAWRDWWSMLTAGKRHRARVVTLAIIGFAVVMHFIALSVIGNFSTIEPDTDRGTLVVITGCALLAWSLMMSQAMEQVTRAFYARSDLDLILVGTAIAVFSTRFGEHAVAAAGISGAGAMQKPRQGFRRLSPKGTLRRKEWTLLARDPWLASQTLMQLLYLLPPGLMLWRAFGANSSDLVLLVPVLVMAAGQLAGGLAWLAISGEDAPDLVATAPIPAGFVIRAKTEAVIGSVALVFALFIAAMTLASPHDALMAALGIVVSAVSATMIQLWFRTQARRKHFRRRQTSSRVATFAEAFSSITWAATAGLAAAGHWQAAFTAITAIGILVAARAVSPKSP